jgi:hypothetical protein
MGKKTESRLSRRPIALPGRPGGGRSAPATGRFLKTHRQRCVMTIMSWAPRRDEVLLQLGEEAGAVPRLAGEAAPAFARHARRCLPDAPPPAADLPPAECALYLFSASSSFRADKLQAVPFPKYQPAGQPKKPGLKPGEDYGTKARRRPPTPRTGFTGRLRKSAPRKRPVCALSSRAGRKGPAPGDRRVGGGRPPRAASRAQFEKTVPANRSGRTSQQRAAWGRAPSHGLRQEPASPEPKGIPSHVRVDRGQADDLTKGAYSQDHLERQ